VSENDRIEIEIFDSVPVDIEQLANELRSQSSFGNLRVHSVPQPPAATPLFSEFSAVLIALSIVAQGFFSEAGKDAYRQFRRLLIQAIQAALPAKEARGGYVFGMKVNRPDSYVLFTFREPPTEAELVTAFVSIPDALPQVPEGDFAEFVFNPEQATWDGPTLADPFAKRYLAEQVARQRSET
jgi:hypothetical protein